MNDHQTASGRVYLPAMLRRPLTAILAGGFLLAPLLGLPGTAAAATLSGSIVVSTAQTNPAVGDVIDVALAVSTAGRPTNVVQSDVTYPAEKLQFLSIDSAGSSYPGNFDSGSRPGLVSVLAYVPGGQGPVTGSGLLVFTMHFKVVGPGSASVVPGGGASIPTATDSPYNVPVTRTGTTVTVGAPSTFSLGGVSLARLGQGARHVVPLLGQGLSSGAALSVSGSGVTAGKVATGSSGSTTTTLVVSAGASPGYRDLTATVGGTVSTCIACLYIADDSRPASVDPASVARGQTSTLHMVGIFEAGPRYTMTAGAGVSVTGVRVVGSSSDPNNDLYATITVSSSAAPGPRNVVVHSLNDFGTVKCVGCLSVS